MQSDRVRQPFSVNALALAAATEALSHVDELERRVEQTVVERVHVESKLADRGLDITGTACVNFSWVSLGSATRTRSSTAWPNAA